MIIVMIVKVKSDIIVYNYARLHQGFSDSVALSILMPYREIYNRYTELLDLSLQMTLLTWDKLNHFI